MKLLLVRHGQTAFNLEHRYLGALDPPLNDAGIAQAQRLRAQLPDSIDVVISSPLLRARQTAEVLRHDTAAAVITDDAFRERNVGVFEGLTQDEARTAFPDLWARNITRQWHAAPDGGETIAAVFARAHTGLTRLLEHYADATVLLVAHGFVAKVIRAIARGDHHDLFDWQLDNAAICALQVSLPLASLEPALSTMERP
ncbi:histidine phosphatase family protein [Pseudomonas sp. MM211]|uniref:histidine phosphatase family protein n=1 Tax=Pseudomonas sp. MM211 TaxID=2866808 RepID=UPI001CED93D8|nr:histidine phosphatase family protein [Pseudomonas sp. MM211]UCJ15286.1 histidine phosphatase family protein [Pseudomonas sp. MM211]